MIPVITPVVISVIESLISVVVTTSSTVVSELIFLKKRLKWNFLSSVKFCVGQNFADTISFKDIKSFLIKKIKPQTTDASQITLYHQIQVEWISFRLRIIFLYKLLWCFVVIMFLFIISTNKEYAEWPAPRQNNKKRENAAGHVTDLQPSFNNTPTQAMHACISNYENHNHLYKNIRI